MQKETGFGPVCAKAEPIFSVLNTIHEQMETLSNEIQVLDTALKAVSVPASPNGTSEETAVARNESTTSDLRSNLRNLKAKVCDLTTRIISIRNALDL